MEEVVVEKVEVTNAPVKFGLGQITNPTPQVAKNIFRVVLYAAAIANLVLQTVVEIPAPVAGMIAKYSLYSVTLVHGISKMFGIDLSDSGPTIR